MRAAMRLTEEGSTFVGAVPKLMAEDTKGALGVTETARDIDRWLLFDEEGAESFILALQRKLGRKEEMPIWRGRYLIHSAGRHNSIVLLKHSRVKMFVKGRRRGRCAKSIMKERIIEAGANDQQGAANDSEQIALT